MAVTLICPTGIPVKLDELITYDAETGHLMWLQRRREIFRTQRGWNRWNSRYAGASALNYVRLDGYLAGMVFSRTYKAHRVAWALLHGDWPTEYIDHIDGDKTNNRQTNLRVVSHRMNACNMRRSAANTSGVTGVCWHKATAKWIAQIKACGTDHYLGVFADKNDAIAARKRAEARLGFHANHGKPKPQLL